jgi:hypothetical protein
MQRSLWLGIGAALLAACGSDPVQTSSTEGSGATTNTGGGGTGAAGAGGATGGGGESGCASNILCGQGVCCAKGEECRDGACLAECPSQVRCGGQCCESGQLCSGLTCATPTGPCGDSVDCGKSEYCETTVGQCLPEVPGGSGCTLAKPPAPFEPVLLWSFTAPIHQPDYSQVVSAPLVVDADKDGTPDVLVTTGDIHIDNGVNAGYLRLLDGKTGAEKWDAGTDALDPANTVNVTFGPALADLDGDGKVEIVAMAAPVFELIAFDAAGKLKWRSHNADGTPFTFPSFYASTIAIADMDGDGQGEVAIGGVIFDSKGAYVSGQGKHREGSGALQYGASSSVLGDADGDGKQEVITGLGAYRKDGSAVWQKPALEDGYPAIADFEQDGAAELVVATATTLRVQRLSDGEILQQLPLAVAAPSGWPGSPAIADFDGDGTPDIAVQFVDGSNNPCTIRVYGYDKTAGLAMKWSTLLHACSGFLTPTAFDFDGDGSVEVLAHDDCRITVLRGGDGQVVLTLPASHATWTEFVSVADVDGDHSADLLFSANDSYGGKNHAADYYNPVCEFAAGEAASHGVFVYSDPLGRWMPTRRVWNEQAYHITNIRYDGSLPKPEVASYGPQGYNDYRVSAQGKGATNAPDLTVSLSALLDGCPASLALGAKVRNQGSLGVPAGLVVAFFEGTEPNGKLLGTRSTTKALLPGSEETLTLALDKAPDATAAYYAVVDEDGASGSDVAECIETNNTGILSGVECPVPK